MTAPLRFDDLIPKGPAQKKGVSYDDLVPSSEEPTPAPTMSAGQYAKGLARSVAQGAPFVGTFLDEAEAAAMAAARGVPYAEERQRIKGEMREFQQAYPKTAALGEIVASLATGGALARGAMKLGTASASKLASRLLASNALQGGIAGAGAADDGVGSRAVGAVTGSVLGGAVGKLLTPTAKITQRDLARDIAASTTGLGGNVRIAATESLRNRLANQTIAARRAAADWIAEQEFPKAANLVARIGFPKPAGLIAGKGFKSFAAGLEPSDITKVQRAAATALPRELTEDVIARQAEMAGSSASALEKALKSAQATATEATTRGASRAKTIAKIGVSKAKADAQQILDAAEAEARSALGLLQDAAPNTSAIQDAVRTSQKAEGKVAYELVDQMGPPSQVDPEVYREILKTPALRAAYEDAAQFLRTEAQNATPGMPVQERLAQVGINNRELPELSLQMFDQIRRQVMDAAQATAGKQTDMTASARRQAMQQINRLEERFLAGYGDDAAANALKSARAQYRARFEQLEALQDGLSLGRAKAGLPAKVVGKNRMELEEMEQRARQYTGAAKEMFQAGASKWVDNLITEGLTDDALKFIQKATATEGSRRRLTLALGEDAVSKLQQLVTGPTQAAEAAQQAVLGRASALSRRATEQAGERARTASEQAQQLARQLTEQQGRASQLKTLQEAATQVRQAFGVSPAAQEAAAAFTQTMAPRLGAEGTAAMQDYAGSVLRRQLSGMSIEQARQTLQLLQQNPAYQRLIGPVLADLERAAQPGPRIVRPALARMVGGRAASLLTGASDE